MELRNWNTNDCCGNSTRSKDLRDVEKAISNLGLAQICRSRDEGRPLDKRTIDYIQSRLDPDDVRLARLPDLVRLARSKVTSSKHCLQRSHDDVDETVDKLHAFLQAPRGWLLTLCLQKDLTLLLKPTFPADDPCEEVKAAARETLLLQFCVDEMHVPARLIVREIHAKGLDGGSCDGGKNVPSNVVPVATDSESIPDYVQATDSKETQPSATSLSSQSPLPVQSSPSSESDVTWTADKRDLKHYEPRSFSRKTPRPQPPPSQPDWIASSECRSKRHVHDHRSRSRPSKSESLVSRSQKASAASTRECSIQTCRQSSCTLTTTSSSPASFSTSPSDQTAKSDEITWDTKVKCAPYPCEAAGSDETMWLNPEIQYASYSYSPPGQRVGFENTGNAEVAYAADSRRKSTHRGGDCSPAALSADLLTSSDVSLQLGHASAFSASLQADPMIWTPELPRGTDQSQNARNSASNPPPRLLQIHSKVTRVNNGDDPSESRDPSHVGTRFSCASRHSSLSDPLTEKSGDRHRSRRASSRETRDLRIVRVSEAALVPESSERRVLVSGHYVDKDRRQTLPFTVFVYKDDDVSHTPGKIVLGGSYVRKMRTGGKHLRWRFRQVVGEMFK